MSPRMTIALCWWYYGPGGRKQRHVLPELKFRLSWHDCDPRRHLSSEMNIYKSKICILSADSDRLPAGSHKTPHKTDIFISPDGPWVTFYFTFVPAVYVTDAMREESALTHWMTVWFVSHDRNKLICISTYKCYITLEFCNLIYFLRFKWLH